MGGLMEISAEVLAKMVYIHRDWSEEIEGDHLVFECNYCSSIDSTFYRGLDNDAPDSNWIATSAAHMLDKHQDLVRKFSDGSW